jgi:copper ion binding protein
MNRKKLSILIVLSIIGIGSVFAADKVVKFRAESMSCGGCAGKIKNAVSAVDGVSGFDVNMETKVVSITYDEQKVKPEQLKDAIVAVKHAAEPYDPNEVIARTVSFRADQMHCGGCAGKVQKNIGAEVGVISVKADPATKEVKIEYDAQKVTASEIKKDFEKFDYAVTKYWESDKIKYVAFQVENLGDKVAALEKKLGDSKDIYDFAVNAKTGRVAIAYSAKSATEEGLAQILKDDNFKLVANK